MFVYKAVTALADVGGSVSFALPDKRIHCVMSIMPEGRNFFLRTKMLGEGHALEGDVHRAASMTEMKELNYMETGPFFPCTHPSFMVSYT